MTEKQTQTAKNDSTAIQAGGSVQIGFSADDVARLIESIGKTVNGLTADAEAKAEAR